MNPNIKEIGCVVKQMQVIGMASKAPSFNQAAADIVKQGIEKKLEQRKWSTVYKDDSKPLN